MKRTEQLLFWLLFLVIVPLECVAASYAYETLTEISSGLYYFVIALNAAFVLLSFKNRVWAAAGLFCLGLLIIPYQLYLVNRLLRIQTEAAGIVAYAYEQKVRSGAFPNDLVDYHFRDPDMRQLVQSYTVRDGGADFQLMYFVGTESASLVFAQGWMELLSRLSRADHLAIGLGFAPRPARNHCSMEKPHFRLRTKQFFH